MLHKLITSIIFLSKFLFSNSIYRSLYLYREKCYTDNFYSQMNVIMQLKILEQNITFPKNKDDIFIIRIYEKNIKEPIHIFKTGKNKAKFSYSITRSGTYKICVLTYEESLYSKRTSLKLNFIIDTSEDKISDSKNIAKMKDFTIVDEKIKKIIRNTENIETMQNYQIKYEDEFAENQIKSSQTLVIVTITQLTICVIIGIYHFFTMKKIFKEKMWSPF